MNPPMSRENDRLHCLKSLQDDGSPLLCCGKCSKWQHIACHDLADRQAGRPKRDWDREEFICCACQDRGKQVLNGNASYDAGRTPNPYYQPAYSSNVPYSSAYSSPHTPRSSYPQHAAITFTHYQPQQHGFSSAHAPQAQSVIPPASATSASYTQSHYSTHGTPPKPTQYTTLQASATIRMSPNLTDDRCSTLLTRIQMAPPIGPRRLLLHSPARTAMHSCRVPTRRRRTVRVRSALRCRACTQPRRKMGTRTCSRSRGREVPTWLPSVAFHTIHRARSPNRINIEHLDG